MLPGFWSLASACRRQRRRCCVGELTEADFDLAVGRCGQASRRRNALDERFVAAFAIAGTAEEALAQARRYREAGASELALTFVGEHPEAGHGVSRPRPRRSK